MVSGDFIPGHTAVAPPGQVDERMFFDAKLVLKATALEYHDVHARSIELSSRSRREH
ncbi:MAG: hypothetical protein AB7H80_03715 [Candidatus Kapaibacterium sp.]